MTAEPEQPTDAGLRVRPLTPPSRRERIKRFGRWLATGYRREPAPARLGPFEEFDAGAWG